ncbi:MAG: hypothetical protein VW162_03925, partial [Alphaproteobacteria bacterium]
MLVSTLLSIMWHIGIVVIFVIGIPFFQRDIDNSDPLVYVTIVDEVPETNQPATSAAATTQSEKIEVASRTPPAPSNAPPPPTTSSSIKNEAVAEASKKIVADELPLADKPEPEQAAIVLPETRIDSQKKPIAKPISAPEKVAVAAPTKRPNIPKPQKKPISRPEVKPAKKGAIKEPVSKPETPKLAQTAKITTRDLLKPLIDSKPVPKPKQQSQRDNALAKETPVKNRDSTMSGVLQNLAQASAATGQKSRSKAPVEDKKTLDAEEINSNLKGSLQVKPNRSMKLGANEIDRLKAHIAQCWSPPAAAPDAEKLEVDVRVRADSDGTVTFVESMDSTRFKADRFYRTAARAAVRAVEECSPLPLPAEKHEVWKDFIFHFDP